MLSASQWTSRNLIENCIGPSGPIGATGPAGQNGPVGHVGERGVTGPTGPRGVLGNIGQIGNHGVRGPELPLVISYVDVVNTSDLNLSILDKYTTFIFYTSSVTDTTVSINVIADGSLLAYESTDFWIRIKPINLSDTYDEVTMNIIVNGVTTTFVLPKIALAQIEPTIYVYWNGSNLVLY